MNADAYTYFGARTANVLYAGQEIQLSNGKWYRIASIERRGRSVLMTLDGMCAISTPLDAIYCPRQEKAPVVDNQRKLDALGEVIDTLNAREVSALLQALFVPRAGITLDAAHLADEIAASEERAHRRASATVNSNLRNQLFADDGWGALGVCKGSPLRQARAATLRAARAAERRTDPIADAAAYRDDGY